MSDGGQRKLGVLRKRVVAAVRPVDRGFGSRHAHALPLGSVRVVLSQIRGHGFGGRLGGRRFSGGEDFEVGGQRVGFRAVRFVANKNPILPDSDQRELGVLRERVALSVRRVDGGLAGRHAHALPLGSVRVVLGQIHGLGFSGGFGRRFDGRFGGRRFGGDFQHEVLHPRVGDHAVRFAAHLNPAAAQRDQTQRRVLREICRAAVSEIDGCLLGGDAHGVLAVRVGVGVVQIVELGILCGFRRGSGCRRSRGRLDGVDQLEVSRERVGSHVVLLVEQLIPFAALRDQTGDKVLFHLHAVGGMDVGRVDIHGGLIDRDANVYRAIYLDERNRLVGGQGRRLKRRRGGRVGRSAQAA